MLGASGGDSIGDLLTSKEEQERKRLKITGEQRDDIHHSGGDPKTVDIVLPGVPAGPTKVLISREERREGKTTAQENTEDLNKNKEDYEGEDVEEVVYKDSSHFLKGTQSANPHNDYCQHFVDTGQRPHNFIRDVDQISKYLTTILQPLTDKSRHKLQSTEDFINATKTVQIPDDYKLVSFDVKSLFTSIPLQLALQCTETAIRKSTEPLPLPTDDIMDLLNICLTSTYFQYNGKHYKQLHGTAMGSPVSVVIAEIVMQNIEERALSTCRQTIPLWLRYVDDTFTAVRHDEIDAFHNHLNEQNTDIQFTREVEENGKLPFLDCLDEIIAERATPPMYLQCDLDMFDLDDLECKFDVLYIDPPLEEYQRRAAGTTFNWKPWTWDEILKLEIEKVAAQRSFLFLWCGSHEGLNEGRKCLKKWGFRRCEDICWIKTNKTNPGNTKYLEPDAIFQHTKEHCLMGIKGTVRRSTDGDFIHANVDIDLIITEEVSCGWLSVGPSLSSSNFSADLYNSYFSSGPEDLIVGSTQEIETLRPKSPTGKHKGDGGGRGGGNTATRGGPGARGRGMNHCSNELFYSHSVYSDYMAGSAHGVTHGVAHGVACGVALGDAHGDAHGQYEANPVFC
ncbi:N6-adenosine-methyltransferase subunit METTL14 [Stylophora pistillata]|uniref:N(6)-adenosine-methyltransferase non-catalytic subunit METTL14 n=1 Tax=Stylophora pistillata TaxID=50429 RepID=A0A2B4SY66_STYPI|nr:N6-adenosine-methyltransferase subunit METTL14 [Stylophora pistillata]